MKNNIGIPSMLTILWSCTIVYKIKPLAKLKPNFKVVHIFTYSEVWEYATYEISQDLYKGTSVMNNKQASNSSGMLNSINNNNAVRDHKLFTAYPPYSIAFVYQSRRDER